MRTKLSRLAVLASASMLVWGTGCGAEPDSEEADLTETFSGESNVEEVSQALDGPPGYYICRYLVSGDPYFPQWSSCCDREDRAMSYWVQANGGTAGWYHNSCYIYGIR